MYELAYVRNLNDDLVGYAIIKHVANGKIKFEGQFVYTKDELEDAVETVNTRNESYAIRTCWPDPQDPEVVALLADPTFDSGGVTYDSRVIDEDASDLVYEYDEDNNPLIDFTNSHVVYKTIDQEYPSSTAERVHKACEAIARKRAGFETD